MGALLSSATRLSLALGAALVLAASPAAASAQKLDVHALDLGTPYRTADYRFIGDAVGDRPVVGLGESIHLTKEMPRVRLNIARYLHQNKGFNVLALEGSLIDAWTAQEHAYASRAPLAERARTFTREALFGLWQTDQMEAVIAYALQSQAGGRPLYLTSFDIQPGTARAHGGSGEKSMGAFLLALRKYDPSISEQQVASWSKRLGPALTCAGDRQDLEAFREVDQWVQGSASAIVAAQRPAEHAAALRLVPTMLRKRLEHCRQWQNANRSMRVYQQARDVHNAQLVTAFLSTSPKLFLWAHHSHLHHNSLGSTIPSMGQHLKRTLGDRLYTIGLFANGGAAVDTSRLDKAQGLEMLSAFAAHRLPTDDRFGVENRLSALSDEDFFLDLKDAPPEWAQPSFSRLETSGRMPTALSRDFDGAILLHNVEGAELNFLPRWLLSVQSAVSWVFQNPVLATLLLLVSLVALGWGVRRTWRRRSARRRLAAGGHSHS